MSTAARNVLMVVVDGHRTDQLGCYGGALARTPAIDALAADGVLCRNAFAVHSVCMPTRATLHTGQYPHRHGVWANGVPLPSSSRTLADCLRRAGFATAACGKVHFEPQQAYLAAPSPVADGQRALSPRIPATAARPYYGFETVHLSENLLGREYIDDLRRRAPSAVEDALSRRTLPAALHDGTWITDQAVGLIGQQAAARRPFFCHVSYHELSPPCSTPAEFAGSVDPATVRTPVLDPADLARRPAWYRQCYEGYCQRGRQPDDAALRRAIASCHDHMRFIDSQFQRLVAALQQAGLWESTVVLYSADHGLSLCDHWQWRHGPFLFDEVTRIPMIWRVPGLTPSGLEADGLLDQTDVMPTLLDLCGVPVPDGVQGCSQQRLLQQPRQADGKDVVFLQERQAPDLAVRGVDPASVTQFAVRSRTHKLIGYHGEDFGEFYDLVDDPGEFRNRWGDPACREAQRALQDRLEAHLATLPATWPERHWDW